MDAYSLYLYRDDRLIVTRVVMAASDEAAKTRARAVLRASKLCEEVEIWQRGRYIGQCRRSIGPGPRMGRPSLRVVGGSSRAR